MVKFDREIAPGKKGKIDLSIKIYPEWQGRDFRKRVMVTTDDQVNPRVVLKLRGKVAGEKIDHRHDKKAVKQSKVPKKTDAQPQDPKKTDTQAKDPKKTSP